MDSNKTIQELKNKVKEFCEDRDWDRFHNPKDLAIGISTEANELLDLFRFKSIEQIQEIMESSPKKKKVEEEFADTLFFVLRFAQMNNLDLDEILANKLEINAQKYPIELVRGRNEKYNERF